MAWTDPSLLIGFDNAIYRVPLEAGLGQPKEFLSSGLRLTPKYDFGDENPKDFPKFDIEGDNLNGDRNWTISYSIDGSSPFQDTDINGGSMIIRNDDHRTFFLPASANGRTIQFKFVYSDAGGIPTERGDIVHFEPYCIPQASKVPIINVQLHLADDLMRDKGRESISADDQLAALVTLSEEAGSVSTSGPWGDNVLASIRSVDAVEMLQDGANQLEYLVTLTLQERESS